MPTITKPIILNETGVNIATANARTAAALEAIAQIMAQDGGGGEGSGKDGFSPIVTITDITGGHRISIRDAVGTKTFDVLDGATGPQGPKGDTGSKGDTGATGPAGADGVSPTVTVTNITGGHRVAITDKDGTKSFDVMNGSGSGGGGGTIANHWQGKTWYGYGTSITNTASEGKYPTYLAQMSGMTFVNKGISGGGIGNLGGYSQGQVYNAICNITDGKLNADLITLETGANDIEDVVPLGTVYDTGTSTLSGCLNDCLRYLQANTTAQIVVFPSPTASSINPSSQSGQKYYEWSKMVEEICYINRVPFINSSNNMGYAKLASSFGSDYTVDGIHHTDLGGYLFAQHIWSYLKNIPLFAMPSTPDPEPSDDWEVTYNGELLVEQVEDGGRTYKVSYGSGYTDTIVAGDEYRVTFKGTVYNCTAALGGGYNYVGNTYWSGGGMSPNEEPFVLFSEANNTLEVWTGEETGTTFAIKVEKKVTS